MIINILTFCMFIFIFLVILLLLFPLTYKMEAKYKGHESLKFRFALKLHIIPLIRLVKDKDIYKINILGIPVKIPDDSEKDTEKKNHISIRLWKDFLSCETIQHIFDLIKGLASIFKPDTVKFDCHLGFEDPYYNGIFLAGYYSLKGNYSDLPLTLNVDWEREVLDLRGEVVGRFILLQVFWRIMFSGLSLKTVKLLLKKRKRITG